MKARKILSLIAAAALTCCAGSTALAQPEPTKDVYGTYAGDGSGSAPVYSYSYAWGDMNIQYVPAGQPKWNPDTHKYDGEAAGTAQWVYPDGSDLITITNHSNAPIVASAVFEGAEEGYTGGFINNGAEVPSAVGTAVDNAPKAELRFRMSADAEGLTAADAGVKVKLGTITLKVTAK